MVGHKKLQSVCQKLPGSKIFERSIALLFSKSMNFFLKVDSASDVTGNEAGFSNSGRLIKNKLNFHKNTF